MRFSTLVLNIDWDFPSNDIPTSHFELSCLDPMLSWLKSWRSSYTRWFCISRRMNLDVLVLISTNGFRCCYLSKVSKCHSQSWSELLLTSNYLTATITWSRARSSLYRSLLFIISVFILLYYTKLRFRNYYSFLINLIKY